MSRMQFLMLRAVEGGASVTEATDEALAWGGRHPDSLLFEHRPYREWASGDDDRDDRDEEPSAAGAQLTGSPGPT